MTVPVSVPLQGGCACSAVRYRLEASPLIVHACHCGNCQRQSGAWHAVNALIESDCVTLLSGTLETQELETPSGAGQTVTRCSQCKVAVWSNYHRMSRGLGDIVRFIRVGTLDEPSRVPPDVHIFARDRNTCAPRPEGDRVFDEFYDPLKVWSPASLERMAKVYYPEIPGLHAASHAVVQEQRT